MPLQSNKFSPKFFHTLGNYTQGKPGTVNSPKLSGHILPSYGGVGFPSKTKAYQNEGGYGTLRQAYPGCPGGNPKNTS